MTRRRWYAEDIALAMELANDGVETWAIALVYGTNMDNLVHQFSVARKHGMAAFPSRSSVKVRRLMRPPVVSGEAARLFIGTLSIEA